MSSRPWSWIVSTAACLAITLSTSLLAVHVDRRRQQRRRERHRRGEAGHHETKDVTAAEEEERADTIRDGIPGLIGRTPMIKIPSLSAATGCDILAKCEFLNPAGSSKDRVAKMIIEDAEAQGLLQPHTGSTIYEGTVGSTGISLATVGLAKGYHVHICMPDDQAAEKYALLERLGATVEKVKPVSIVDKNQFCRLAEQRAQEHADRHGGASKGYFANQFENLANFKAHYTTTAPEILSQAPDLHAFVMGAGTGGSIAGIARYLKQYAPRPVHICLADPDGSGLYNKVKYGTMFNRAEKEGHRRRHQVDTVIEGIGINRLTANFLQAMEENVEESIEEYDHEDHSKDRILYVDDAVHVSDQEAISMSRHLLQQDGLFVGSSSAVNCVAAVRLAQMLGPGHTIVTLLADSGLRHLTKFWNDQKMTDMQLDVSKPFSFDETRI